MKDKFRDQQDAMSADLHHHITMDCEELMEKISRNIEALALVSDGDDSIKIMTSIHRQVHSLKGLGAVSYNSSIEIVAHRLEDYLSGHTSLTTKEIDDVYAFLDCIRILLARKISPSKTEFARIVRDLPTPRAPVSAPEMDIGFANASTPPIEAQNIEAILIMPQNLQERLIEAVMRSCGIRVTNVGSGFEAFEMAVYTQPDLIIATAIGDPLDGIEIANIFRAARATKDIPIILATSSSDGDFPRNLPAKTMIARKGENFSSDFSRCVLELGIISKDHILRA